MIEEFEAEILIVGAGPGGLVLAAVLAAHDVNFRIIDGKAGPTDQSRAAIVHVRTLELLDRLGLARRAVTRGVKITWVEIYEHGRRAASFPLAAPAGGDETQYPHPLALEQNQTERLLIEQLTEGGRSVEWKTELVGLSVGVHGVTATVRRSGGEQTVQTRWVVGADGARSAVRHALGISFTGSTFTQTGLLADVDLDLADTATLRPHTLRLNLTSGGFVGVLRLSNGRYRLFGAVPPAFTAPSADGEVSHEAYAEVAPGSVQRWLDEYFVLDARITRTVWTALFRIHSRIADRFRDRGVFLLGDAAHIHSPAGGQGMNLAIGDAVNLGWKLALVARGHAHSQLLDSYEAERRPVAERVLRGSDRGFALETTANPIAVWVRSHVAARLIGPLTRLRAVHAAIFTLFAQTWITYPDSPAVAGDRRHRPRPGERAPQALLAATDGAPPQTVHGLCGGLRHHLLCFEGLPAAPGLADRHRDLQQLVDAYRVSIDVHQVAARHRTLHARYGVRDPWLFLIRPDGHVAYSGPRHDLRGLSTYLDALFARAEAPAPPR